MDKMREEFEDWAKGAGYLVIKEEDGEYSFQHMRHAWESWKASRAALCVDLPPQWFSRSDDEEVMSATDVIDAINCSGVRHE